MNETRFVQVAVRGPIRDSERGVLTYAVPNTWASIPAPGTIVWVPVLQRFEPGMILGAAEPLSEDLAIRELHAQVSPALQLTYHQLETALWMSRETVSSVYSCAALFLPQGILERTIEQYELNSVAELPETFTASQQRVVDLLRERGRLSLEQLRTATGQKLDSVLKKLVVAEVITRHLDVDHHIPTEPEVQILRLVNDDVSLTERAPKQRAIQDVMIRRQRLIREGDSEFATVEALRQRVPADAATLRALQTKGIIELRTIPQSEAPAGRPVAPPVLTSAQANVWNEIERTLRDGDSTPTLLFGVTGSGKTEIYLRAVAWCLRFGKSAIVLLPEIALTTQVVSRFMERFPGQVAVLHSQLTNTQRYLTWKGIQSGKYRVVVGPRSALFAPVNALGVIVLDEEHESAYKQDSEPHYHARRVAEFISRQQGASVILGSATPAIETWYRSEQGDIRRLELSSRVSPASSAEPLELPPVEVVDMRLELHQSNTSLISRKLQNAIERSLNREEQAIVLLNRRGQSTVVVCRSCGQALECPRCDIPMVFHRDRNLMICHRCDYRETPPGSCPDCQGRLDFFGSGTQRVEEQIRALFPLARVLRWDQDSVRRQGGFAAMLGRIERREADIVVGTQMVAKGFDLPLVTTVGVIQADSMLQLPDFRSAERTFQLVTQVAGRAGRRAPGSTVIVQTYAPDHYAIRTAAKHDYPAFYEAEIAFRKDFRYPPVTRLIRCVYRHNREQQAALEAEALARRIAKLARLQGVRMDLLGPAPAFVARIRSAYQWQLVVRGDDLDALLDDFPVSPGWVVDVDPQSML